MLVVRLSSVVGDVSCLENVPIVARALDPLVLQNYRLVEVILPPPVSSHFTVLAHCVLFTGLQRLTCHYNKWFYLVWYVVWYVAMFLVLFTLSTTTKDGTEAVDEEDEDDDDDEDEETHAGPEEASRPASPPPVVGQSPSGGTVRGDGEVHLICRNILVRMKVSQSNPT